MQLNAPAALALHQPGIGIKGYAVKTSALAG
jgi:hypothetical protein